MTDIVTSQNIDLSCWDTCRKNWHLWTLESRSYYVQKESKTGTNFGEILNLVASEFSFGVILDRNGWCSHKHTAQLPKHNERSQQCFSVLY
jgi:hypothetical protein